MMKFTVLFTNFGFYGLTANSEFEFGKYLSVLKTKKSCKITEIMFS